jgi:hypothetical protein
VRLQLSFLAYNLGTHGGGWCCTPRYYWLLLAERHLTRRVFATILRRIWALPLLVG